MATKCPRSIADELPLAAVSRKVPRNLEVALRNEHVRVGDPWLDDAAKRRGPEEAEDGDDAIGEDRSHAVINSQVSEIVQNDGKRLVLLRRFRIKWTAQVTSAQARNSPIFS
jgi:hypothetical protein